MKTVLLKSTQCQRQSVLDNEGGGFTRVITMQSVFPKEESRKQRGRGGWVPTEVGKPAAQPRACWESREEAGGARRGVWGQGVFQRTQKASSEDRNSFMFYEYKKH